MNIEMLQENAAEALRNVIADAAKDIEALVDRCERESARQGRKILPKLGFSLTLDGDKATYALSYGVRAKREGVIEIDEQEKGQEKMDFRG